MAINFSKTVSIAPIDEPEVAATRLEGALGRLFSGDSSVQEDLTAYGAGWWRLRDPGETTSTGPSLESVFAEFREHDLTPRLLVTTKNGTTGSAELFSINVYYFIDNGYIDLDISGTNRITVDGIAATCERIKSSLERPATENSGTAPNGALTAPTSAVSQPSASTLVMQPAPDDQPKGGGQQSNKSWLARTWRDHTATFVVTVVGGVLVIVVALMLGLKP